MAQCSGCGTQNNPDARFCRQCGRMLAAPSPDDAPVTIIPGNHDFPAQPASKRGVLVIALFALGVIAALAIGYVIGSKSGGSAPPTVQPAPARSIPPANTAGNVQPRPPESPAAEAEAPAKPKRTAPPAAEPTETPKPAPASNASPAQPESPETRGAKLRQELAGCNQFNVFCQERARWRYCKELWGRIPECPQAAAHTPTN